MAAGDALRFTLQANASSLATGYYDWSITLTAWFSGDALWFASDGAGGYLKAPGDTSFSTLVKNGNNTFTLTSKYGIQLRRPGAAVLARRQ